jgi:hypothetical protein
MTRVDTVEWGDLASVSLGLGLFAGRVTGPAEKKNRSKLDGQPVAPNPPYARNTAQVM